MYLRDQNTMVTNNKSALPIPWPNVTIEGGFFDFFLHPTVSFFFTGILARWDQNSGFLKKMKKIFF